MSDQINIIFELMGKIFNAIWQYDLIIVSGNNIKVSNLLFALMLFIIGIKYSSKIASFIKTHIRNKIGHDKDAVNNVEKVILYLVFIFFVITVLEIANIPLSTFAFIGGALAIGVGFGAQTIIGNFISSLVIMVERPIKIGDLIEIEGVTGIVTSIGARCVVITTPSKVEVLVPNNKLMQNSLVNWTLSDNIVKYQAEVKILKDVERKINPTQFIELFDDMLKKQRFVLEEYEPEVFLTKIDEKYFTFLLMFHFDLQKVQVQEYIKNTINLALFDILKGYNFIVTYPKIVDIKPPSDKTDK